MAKLCVPYYNGKPHLQFDEKSVAGYLLYSIDLVKDYETWTNSLLQIDTGAQEAAKTIEGKFKGLQQYFEKRYHTRPCPADFQMRTWNKFPLKDKTKEHKHLYLEILNKQTFSVFFGIFLTAMQEIQRREFNVDWGIICATGDVEYNENSGELIFLPVANIKDKFCGEFKAEADKYKENTYLFLYIGDRDEIPEGSKQGENANITVKRISPGNSLEDIMTYLFKPFDYNFDFNYINLEDEQIKLLDNMKTINAKEAFYGFLPGSDFQNLERNMLNDPNWRGFFIHGELGSGKTTTAMAIVRYLAWINKIWAPIWVKIKNEKLTEDELKRRPVGGREITINKTVEYIRKDIINQTGKHLNELGNSEKKYLVVIDNLDLPDNDLRYILGSFLNLFPDLSTRPYLIFTSSSTCNNDRYLNDLHLVKIKPIEFNKNMIEDFIQNIAQKNEIIGKKINASIHDGGFHNLVEIIHKKCGSNPHLITHAISSLENQMEIENLYNYRFFLDNANEYKFFPLNADPQVFYGREDKLDKMWDAFSEGKQIIVLWGIDGIGKTKLAEMFTRVYKEYIGRVHRKVSVESKTKEQTPKLLDALIQGFDFSRGVVENCIGCLEEEEYRLKHTALRELPADDLIFIDNAHFISLPDIDDILGLDCRFIITSPQRISNRMIADIHVDVLNFSMLKDIFKYNCGSSFSNDDEKLNLLFNNINYHTLTVELLARVMCDHNKTIDIILEISEAENLIEENSMVEHISGMKDTVIGHLVNIYHSASVNMSESERRFLSNLALIPNKGINANLFLEFLGITNYNEVNSLSSLSWVIYDRDAQHIQLQPIITITLLATNTINLNDCTGTINGIIEMLDFSTCSSFSDVENLMEYGEHLEKMLNHFGDSDTRLFYKLSEGYNYLGKHNESEAIASRGVTTFGMQQTSEAFIFIANVRINKWDYDSAIMKLNQALSYEESAFKRGSIYIYIAKCYLALGRNDDAANAFFHAHDSYMKASHAFGAGLALMNYFMTGKYTLHHSKLLKKYRKFILDIAEDDLNCGIFYFHAYTVYIAKKKKYLSSGANMEELGYAISSTFEHNFYNFHLKGFLKKYFNKINKTAAEPFAFFTYFFSDNDLYNTNIQETEQFIKFIEWMESCCKKIGHYVDSAQVLGMIIGLFPELNISSGLVHDYLAEKFKNYEQRLLISNAMVVQSIISFANLKGRLLGSGTELSNLNYLVDKQIFILPSENQYSLALSYEALGNYYSNNIKHYGSKWAKQYFEKALEIKQKFKASPVEEAKLYHKMGNYARAIEILKDNSCYNCTLCKAYVSYSTDVSYSNDFENEEKSSIIRDNINEICKISRRLSMCYKACRADTFYILADCLNRSGSRGIHAFIQICILNIRSYLISRKLRMVNKYAVKNLTMMAESVKKANLAGVDFFFLQEALALAYATNDSRTLTGLLCDYFDEKYIDECFARYVSKKTRKLKKKRCSEATELLLILGETFYKEKTKKKKKWLQMLYNDRMYEMNSQRGGTFALFALQQIKTVNFQKTIFTIKKITVLIDVMTEMLFDNFLIYGFNLKGAMKYESNFDKTIKLHQNTNKNPTPMGGVVNPQGNDKRNSQRLVEKKVGGEKCLKIS